MEDKKEKQRHDINTIQKQKQDDMNTLYIAVLVIVIIVLLVLHKVRGGI